MSTGRLGQRRDLSAASAGLVLIGLGWSLRRRGRLTPPLLAVFAEGLHRVQFPVVPTPPAAMATTAGPLVILPTSQIIDENVMLWSTEAWPKIANGGSGFTPRRQGHLREVLKSFPDERSIRMLRELNIRSVIALRKNPIDPDNNDYDRAADPTVDITGLSISRRDDGESLIYELR